MNAPARPCDAFRQYLKELTAPGQPFELIEKEIEKRRYRVYQNAPATLSELFAPGRGHGDKTFLVYEGERISFAEFFRRADAAGHQLVKEYGIAPGERAAIVMRNYPEWLMAFVAIGSIGAVPVPINSWGRETEIRYALEDSGSRVAFFDEARCQLAADACKDLGIKAIVARPESKPPDLGAARDWEDFLAGALGQPMPQVQADTEAPALLMYTSGTTGRPKGVLSRQRQVCQAIFNFECTGLAMGMVNGDIMGAVMKDGDSFSSLLAVPLFHVSGCHAAFLINLRSGRQITMMYKWDPVQALHYIEEEKVGLLGVAPAMMMELLQHPAFDDANTSSLFSLGGGGSAFPPDLAPLIEEKAPGRMPGCGYGSTESNAAACTMNGHLFRERPTACGLQSPIMEVQIRDEELRPLSRGKRGEIWLYGPTVADGYWNRPEETADCFRDGWYRSGDIGFLDEDGYLHIVDRIKDMVIRAGENISSQEVEAALSGHPEVMDAAVYGLPHKRLGEELAATVRPNTGTALQAEDLREHVAEQLAHFKVPVHIEIDPAPLPRNAAGKVLKNELRERHAKKLGLNRSASAGVAG